ncbi:MAG: DUF1232 domain-containing protein [Deltaproteobacteria bacterium]|nr:DUF1232 domain-containing protein [Deltaproteobacteria bacterium]
MASDEIKTRCLETFGSWIGSLSGDIEALMEVVKDDSLDRGAREASTGGINYLFKSLDLIPDGIDDIGYLDDAFTIRVSAKLVKQSGFGGLGDETKKRLESLASDTELIGGLLGDELYQRFESYVTDLRLGAARGRMVSEILDDASTMKELEAEVAQFCKDYEPLKFSKDEKNLIKLTAFFDAKLPRESRVP